MTFGRKQTSTQKLIEFDVITFKSRETFDLIISIIKKFRPITISEQNHNNKKKERISYRFSLFRLLLVLHWELAGSRISQNVKCCDVIGNGKCLLLVYELW